MTYRYCPEDDAEPFEKRVVMKRLQHNKSGQAGRKAADNKRIKVGCVIGCNDVIPLKGKIVAAPNTHPEVNVKNEFCYILNN